jgi:preprotein translocase subunit SecF
VSLITRLYRGETEFDVISNRNRWFVISGVAIVLSILALVVLRLDLSVDFTGGTIVESPNPNDVSVGEMRDGLTAIGQGDARIQVLEGEEKRVRVQTEALDAEALDELTATVAEIAGVTFDDTEVDAVGPTFGEEITRRAVEALIVFLAVVVLFISWRFEWKMAVGAIAALFHDLVITFGIYALLGFEVTPATVIAILTILGYSLYDTVVVYDKITENVEELQSKFTFAEIANLSMNQVLMRSINTSLTSLLPIGSLLFVGSFLLGATTLREFALALFIGVALGTYSSIFVATPLLTVLKEREPQWARMERRLSRRDEETAAAAAAAAATAVAVEVRDTGATPRAPKKRKKRR